MSKHFLEKVAINSKNGDLSGGCKGTRGPWGVLSGGYSLPCLKPHLSPLHRHLQKGKNGDLAKGKTKEKVE